MFDLEKSIADWRKQMRAAGIHTLAALEELENHLRDDISHLAAGGNTDEEAFRTAAARVGKPAAVAAEFKKGGAGSSRPIVIGSSVWAGMAVILVVFLLSRWAEGKLSLLLAAHIFTLTAGYGAALLAGGFGIYCVLGERRFIVSADRRGRLARAVCLSTQTAAGLVVAGLISGMLWSHQNRGHFLGSDPREIGTLGAAAWLVFSSLVQQFGRLNHRTAMRLSLVSNMVIGLAWFGAGAFSHGYNAGSYWPLDVFWAVNLFFLGLSLSHRPNAVEA